MPPKTLLLFAFLIFFACNNSSPPKKEKSDFEKREDLDSLNKLNGIRLSKENFAILGWDSLPVYTYKLQEKLVDSVISFTGRIADVIKLNSGYLLKINGDYDDSYVAEILVDSIQFKEIEPQISPKKNSERGCFIFRVNSMYTTFPKMSVDAHYYGDKQEDEDIDDNIDANLTYDFRDILTLFKGKLISYALYDKLPYE